MNITIRSFGFRFDHKFKRGEKVIDCRSGLPDPSLRFRTLHNGLDKQIQAILNRSGKNFMEETEWMIAGLIREYELKGRKNAAINFGCQGGLYRSVYVADKTAKWLEKLTDHNITIEHLDMHKYSQ